jgi:hypothetical protein
MPVMAGLVQTVFVLVHWVRFDVEHDLLDRSGDGNGLAAA